VLKRRAVVTFATICTLGRKRPAGIRPKVHFLVDAAASPVITRYCRRAQRPLGACYSMLTWCLCSPGTLFSVPLKIRASSTTPVP
jgi:hypothetical protein